MTNILEQVELGVDGLHGRYWTDYHGDWWDRFVRMACQQPNSDKYEYASVPLLVLDYMNAPTEWVQTSGTAGKWN